MGLRWSQNNISPIGIDFGADSIKLLQLVTEDPPQLVAAAQRDIPEAARKQSQSYYDFAASALREMVRDAKMKTKRVVASISASQTYVQHVRLPVGDGEIVQQQLEMELRGRLPMDPLSMVVRHVDVGQVFSDGTAKQEVICLAASRESVMRSVKAIRQAGLDVVGMHCEPMAILAAFSHLFRREGDEKRTTFFIDVGGATTKALIAHGKKLVF
ncbi:MAG: pilus assembly protein PilM, partial [Phycisphaeraceae bacterium]